MATRSGKLNPVNNKVCTAVPKARIVRVGGRAKIISGKLTRRGDS